MKVDRLEGLTVRELAEGYQDSQDEGVLGYGGRLDIRPPYQREFIYKDAQRDAVIDTVIKRHPLNVMYWAVRSDDRFEVIDGQQRTISICQYVEDEFMFDGRYFSNLRADEQEEFYNYELMVYLCEGSDSEKLAWFKTINIAGEKLTGQELRNAVYSGSWVTDAKRYFSKTGGPAYGVGGQYLNGVAIRQEYLEAAIKWISGGNIEEYMGKNQHAESAEPLWDYFRTVIDWVESVFPPENYRKEMKFPQWGELYNEYKDQKFDPRKLEEEIVKLMADDDVTRNQGVYTYVITREEKHLHIRSFTDTMKQKAYNRQKGVCPSCGEKFGIKQMEADHITPWSEGGPTIPENCQMLCKKCNRTKSNK